MSFKLLIKQAFRSLFKKLRLYLSLIIFLFVAFSILNGTATYFSSWIHDMNQILNTGKQENFEIPNFRFASSGTQKSSTSNIRFTSVGQEKFKTYLEGLISKDNESNNIDWNSFIDKLGLASGDVSTLSGSSSWVNDLNNASAYWGHNLMQMFLSNEIRTNFKGTQTSDRDFVTGVDKAHRDVTLDVRPLSSVDAPKDSPYVTSQLADVTHYKTKIRNDEGTKTPVLVTPNYIRYTHSKIGQDISLIVNTNTVDGYIAGTAADKYHIFFNDNSAEVFIDLNTLGKLTNENYVKVNQMIGYYPIKDSDGSFKNSDEFKIAYKNINEILLGDGNSPNKKDHIFASINPEQHVSVLAELDESNATLSFYKNPMSIYSGFMIILIIVLVVLVIIVSYFIIDESIRSEKKTLWFLKSLGVTNWRLSLLNSLSAFIPLLIALMLTVPGTMLIMEFFTIAISTGYVFSIGWYALTYISAIVFVCLLIGIMVVFVAINQGLISGKALSIQTQDKMSKFQFFIARITNPWVQHMNGKFRVGFAFVKQNLIKNLVTFVLFLVVFSISLFGIQFMRSIHNQEYQYQKWMGDYHAISTLSPKQIITWDQKNTTYKYVDNSELQKEQADDRGQATSGVVNVANSFSTDNTNAGASEQDSNQHLDSSYNFDGFAYMAKNWFGAVDESDTNVQNWMKENPGMDKKYMVIDSKKKEVVSLPNEKEYYTGLLMRMSLILASNNETNPQQSRPLFYSYDQAVDWWNKLNADGVNVPFSNLNYTTNINEFIQGEDYKGRLAPEDQMNLRQNYNQNVSLAQWSLRQFRDISLWDIKASYIKSLMIMEQSLSPEIQNQISVGMDEILQGMPEEMKPVLQSILDIYNAQKNIFGIKHPSFGFNFGNIVKPEELPKTKTAVALSASYKGVPLFAYGMKQGNENQPFTNPIKIPEYTKDEVLPIVKGDDGIKYKVLDAEFSAASENIHKWKVGDIVPISSSQTGLTPKQGNYFLALRIKGFVQDDSVITEAFFDERALDAYIAKDIQLDSDFDYQDMLDGKISLDNTFYTTTDVPYFLQHITVPHMMNNGKSIDDYIYKLDTFTSSHKTTAQITKVFADTVDSYSSLMTKVIILLVVIAVAISSIIITLILLENKKTILLFKAMGYGKSDVIWYVISGYLIAALAALGFSFAISAGATVGLAPMFAENIFLQLTFTAYWLWFVLGIILTVGFMALVIVSIITYTRYLKPRDAFATL